MSNMQERHLELAAAAKDPAEEALHRTAARLHGEAHLSEHHRRRAVAATQLAFDSRAGGTALAQDAGWEEGKHKRAADGKFGSGGAVRADTHSDSKLNPEKLSPKDLGTELERAHKEAIEHGTYSKGVAAASRRKRIADEMQRRGVKHPLLNDKVNRTATKSHPDEVHRDGKWSVRDHKNGNFGVYVDGESWHKGLHSDQKSATERVNNLAAQERATASSKKE